MCITLSLLLIIQYQQRGKTMEVNKQRWLHFMEKVNYCLKKWCKQNCNILKHDFKGTILFKLIQIWVTWCYECDRQKWQTCIYAKNFFRRTQHLNVRKINVLFTVFTFRIFCPCLIALYCSSFTTAVQVFWGAYTFFYIFCLSVLCTLLLHSYTFYSALAP